MVKPIWCVGSAYKYRHHQRALDSKRPGNPEPVPPAVPGSSHVETPILHEVWDAALANHLDDSYSTYLLKGLREGFRVGFEYGSCRYTSARSNMQSAEVTPSVITDFLLSEL